MITREEVESYRQNDGRIGRVERSALVWLVFYSIAAVVGLAAKVGSQGVSLFAALF